MIRHVHLTTTDGRPRWETCVGRVAGRTGEELLGAFAVLSGALVDLPGHAWFLTREKDCAGPLVARDHRGNVTTLEEAAAR